MIMTDNGLELKQNTHGDYYIQFEIKHKSCRKFIKTPDGQPPVFETVKVDNTILRALIKAHLWQRELDRGKYESNRELCLLYTSEAETVE